MEATAESTHAPHSGGSDGDLFPERGGDLSHRPLISMSDLTCSQLTPKTVYPAALAIHNMATVRKYTDDTPSLWTLTALQPGKFGKAGKLNNKDNFHVWLTD